MTYIVYDNHGPRWRGVGRKWMLYSRVLSKGEVSAHREKIRRIFKRGRSSLEQNVFHIGSSTLFSCDDSRWSWLSPTLSERLKESEE